MKWCWSESRDKLPLMTEYWLQSKDKLPLMAKYWSLCQDKLSFTSNCNLLLMVAFILLFAFRINVMKWRPWRPMLIFIDKVSWFWSFENLKLTPYSYSTDWLPAVFLPFRVLKDCCSEPVALKAGTHLWKRFDVVDRASAHLIHGLFVLITRRVFHLQTRLDMLHFLFHRGTHPQWELSIMGSVLTRFGYELHGQLLEIRICFSGGLDSSIQFFKIIFD